MVVEKRDNEKEAKWRDSIRVQTHNKNNSREDGWFSAREAKHTCICASCDSVSKDGEEEKRRTRDKTRKQRSPKTQSEHHDRRHARTPAPSPRPQEDGRGELRRHKRSGPATRVREEAAVGAFVDEERKAGRYTSLRYQRTDETARMTTQEERTSHTVVPFFRPRKHRDQGKTQGTRNACVRPSSSAKNKQRRTWPRRHPLVTGVHESERRNTVHRTSGESEREGSGKGGR